MEQHQHGTSNEPAFREDAPFFSRMSLANMKGLVTAAAVGGSIVAAFTIMQFRIDSQDRQITRQDRLCEQLTQQLAQYKDRKDATDNRQDSNLIEINAERRRVEGPRRPERVRMEVYTGALRTPHTLRHSAEVPELWANFTFTHPAKNAGWLSALPLNPRGPDVPTRGRAEPKP